MYVSQNTCMSALSMQCMWKQRKTNKYQSQHPVCDGFDIYNSCLDVLSYTSQHPSSAVSMCSVHAAQRVPVWTRRVCTFCVHMWTMWLWLKGGTVKGPLREPLPCYFPLVSPCPQWGGWFCDLPPTHTRGRQPPHKSVRKGVAEAIYPPIKEIPFPSSPQQCSTVH